jgi:hypothetical protein
VRVKLLKKYADVINDIDLGPYSPGDEFDCSEGDARMLILEQWAEPIPQTPITNELPAPKMWDIIEDHRDGQKDRLT